MRPDEHKKKKNAQYKKKHGIENKAQTDSKKTNKHKEPSHHNEPQSTHTDSTSKPKQHSKTEDATVEEVDESVNYRRRKVTSNWERYESLDLSSQQSDVDELRGADFHTLLNSTSSAIAQFQFEDEKLWSVDEDTASSDGITALDCTALAESLLCVPVHQRLDLPLELIEPHLVEQYEELARQHEKKYDLQGTNSAKQNSTDNQSKLSSVIDENVSRNPSGASQKLKLQNKTNEPDFAQGTKDIDNMPAGNMAGLRNVKKSKDIYTPKPKGHEEDFLNALLEKSPSEIPVAADSRSLHKQHDDHFLDSLLEEPPPKKIVANISRSSETNNLVKTSCSKLPIENIYKENVDSDLASKENELDFLLNLDLSAAASNSTSQSSMEKNELSTCEKKDNLEEWLDDLLGD